MTKFHSKLRGENCRKHQYIYDPVYGESKVLQANFGYVIVDVVNSPSTSPGGIVIPEAAKQQSNKGIVTSHGFLDIPPEDLLEDEVAPIDLTGRTVFFPLYGGHKINYAGKDYIVLKEDDILAFEVGE
jgi:chaperonin GroES